MNDFAKCCDTEKVAKLMKFKFLFVCEGAPRLKKDQNYVCGVKRVKEFFDRKTMEITKK